MINTVSLTHAVVLLAGRRCQSQKHRQGFRHEDSQQMGDAEAS